MSLSSLSEWRKYPVSTLYVIGSILVTVAASLHLGNVRYTHLNFNYRLILTDHEWQRLVTSALYFGNKGSPNWFQFASYMVIIHGFSSKLEGRRFSKSRFVYATSLLAGLCLMHLPGYFLPLKTYRIRHPPEVFILVITSWYSFEFWWEPLFAIGPLAVKSCLLPFLFVAFRVYTFGAAWPQEIKELIIGVAVGIVLKISHGTDPVREKTRRARRQEQAKTRESESARKDDVIKVDLPAAKDS